MIESAQAIHVHLVVNVLATCDWSLFCAFCSWTLSSSLLQDSRLVYKHYATLYFVFVFDSSENELAMLDLIQGTVTLLSWLLCWSQWGQDALLIAGCHTAFYLRLWHLRWANTNSFKSYFVVSAVRILVLGCGGVHVRDYDGAGCVSSIWFFLFTSLVIFFVSSYPKNEHL